MIIKRMSAVLVVLTLAIIACQTPGIAPSLTPTVQSVPVPNNQPAPLEATSPVEQQGILADLYEKVIPSIVAVQTSTGLGSGFVFDGQGHVVTNFHVVEGTNQVEVDFMSGYKAYGKVIGTDLDSDLAVVEVQNAPAEELHPVALGNSEELKVGQTVVAIGKRVVPVLISKGKYDYPYLGISSFSDLSLDVINELKLKSFIGAYVTEVVPGGPADKAGIKAGNTSTSIPNLNAGGDLIIAIDNRPISGFDELLAYLITNKQPGDTVVLTVLRGEEKTDVNVKLEKRP